MTEALFNFHGYLRFGSIFMTEILFIFNDSSRFSVFITFQDFINFHDFEVLFNFHGYSRFGSFS